METEPEKPDIQNMPKKVSKLDMIKKMQAMRENQQEKESEDKYYEERISVHEQG